MAAIEQITEALVGLPGHAETGVLAHGPQAPRIHRGLDAAGVGVLTGKAHLTQVVAAGVVERGVEQRRSALGGATATAGGRYGDGARTLGQCRVQDLCLPAPLFGVENGVVVFHVFTSPCTYRTYPRGLAGDKRMSPPRRRPLYVTDYA